MKNDIVNRGWYFQGDFIETGLVERSDGMARGTVMIEKKILGFIPIRLRVFLGPASLIEIGGSLMSMAKQVLEAEDAQK